MDSGAHEIDDDSIAAAVRVLRSGGVVAFPTETVYGLGANALDPSAVARIFEIKGRPRFDPLIVHVATPEAARECVAHWPDLATRLAERFWPGPLTLVLAKRESIPDIVTAGLPNVGIRVPDHPLARRLLERVGVPLAAPSANPFGRISPTTAQHVRDSLGAAVKIVLDGGPCRTGVESTVLALREKPTLLRPGGIPVEDIEAVIGPIEHLPSSSAPARADAARESPGMLDIHYAPRTPLRFESRLIEQPAPGARIGYLGLRLPDDPQRFAVVEVLSASGDLKEAAANLFAAMRRLDALGLDLILAGNFPAHGLGGAIQDRLERASAKG